MEKNKFVKGNKMFRILSVVAFFFLVISTTQSALAATISDSSGDDTFSMANRMNIGDSVRGSITEMDDLDYYRFQLNSAGCVSLDMTSYMKYYCIRIYDSNGEEVWYTDRNEWTESIGYRRDKHTVYLEKGNYYLQINGYRYDSWDKSTGKYECATSFVSSNVNNNEPDNSFSDATNVVLGNAIKGQISVNDDYDTFKFGLSDSGCVSLDMTSYMRFYCIRVYDLNGEEIWYTDRNEWIEAVGYRQDSHDLYLKKGTYYMQINGYRYNSWDKSTGKYVVGTKFQSSNVSFDRDDNSFASANAISWNTKYRGQVSENDDYDTYRFQNLSDRTIVVNMTSYMKYYCIKVFNAAGEELWYTDENEWNSKAGYRSDKHNIKLSAGTCYMQINGYRYGSWNKSTGKYVFCIEGLNQKNCNHEYMNKTVYPNYFNKGYDLHKCEKCGKSYMDNYTEKKKLGQGVVSLWSKSGKGKLILQWYTISDASGYTIRYCKSKKMKKGVKTINVKGQKKYKKTIKRLSRRKKYYVQVRAYKKSGNKIVYGKWSGKRKLKTK